MCGGSAKSRCLPSTVNGERTKPAASSPPLAIGPPGLEGGAPVGASRPMPCAVPPRHDQDVPACGAAAAAVAEDVAALDRVHVEHGRASPQRVAVAEPQVGADPRPELEVGVRLRAGRPARRGQVARPRPCGSGQPGRDHVGHQPVDLGRGASPASGRCSATPSTGDAVAASSSPPRAGRGAVMPCRRIEVIRSRTTRASGLAVGRAARRSSSRPTVWMTRCGRLGDSPRAEGPPRGEHQQVAAEAGRDGATSS